MKIAKFLFLIIITAVIFTSCEKVKLQIPAAANPFGGLWTGTNKNIPFAQ